MKRLEHICTEEKVKYEKEVRFYLVNYEKVNFKIQNFFKALETAVTCSEGDLRKAITYLQVK